jgi:transcriptional regulator with XRE-family HTH domain
MAKNSMGIKPTLTEELHLLRRRKKWTLKKVATDLMVSIGTLRTWEDGIAKPFPDNAERIRDYIDIHNR